MKKIIILFVFTLSIFLTNDNLLEKEDNFKNICLTDLIVKAKADSENEGDVCTKRLAFGKLNKVDVFQEYCLDNKGYFCGYSTKCQPRVNGYCSQYICSNITI